MSVSPFQMTAPARIGLATPVAASVAEDLDAILSASREPRPPARRRLQLGMAGRRAAEPARRPRPRRAAQLGGLVAVACLGISAGALMTRLPAAPAGPQASTAPPVQIASAPMPAAPRLGEAVGLAPSAAVADEPALGPLRALADDEPQPAAAKASPRRAGRERAAAVCGADRRCDRAEVLAADRRLRDAYSNAVRAGVARGVLVEYRDSWWSLRRKAPKNPAAVVAGYRRMAGELDQLSRTQRHASYAPRRRDPLSRLGHEIASLLP